MLAILIDLSKDFYTVVHRIFVTKLENLRAKWTNLGQFSLKIVNNSLHINFF